MITQQRALVTIGLVIALLLPALFVVEALHSYLRLVWAAGWLLGLIILWVGRPTSALLISLLWLVTQGLQRRLFDMLQVTDGIDVLTLVVPVATMIAALASLPSQTGGFGTGLQRVTVALIGGFVFGAINSLSSNLEEAMAAFLVIVSPIAAFVLLRGRLTDVFMRRLATWFAVVSYLAAMYGLFQHYIGFPVWDLRWLEEFGYASLRVGDSYRSFASLTSAQEYVSLLGIGVVASIVIARRRSLLIVAPGLALLSLALLTSGSRGGLLFAAVGALSVLALRMTKRVWVIASVLALAFVSSPFMLRALGSFGGVLGVSSDVIDRQVNGLSNPFNSELSTGGLHLELILENMAFAFANPLGSGIGVARALGDRNDISSMSVGLGLLGLLLYFAFVVAVLGGVMRVVTSAGRRTADLFATGILVVAAGHWLNGSLYVVCLSVWVAICWTDGRASITFAERKAVRFQVRNPSV